MIPIERTPYRAAFVALLILVIPYTRNFFYYYGIRWAYILSTAFVVAYLITPVIRSAASSIGAVDKPSPRKVHAHPTPLLGGLAIYIAFVCSLVSNFIFSPEVVGILVGSTLVMATGMMDDITGVGARTKLIVQLLATAIVMASGVTLVLLPHRWFGSFIINGLLTFLWIVGITNSMNFFDGMDGLAPGLTIIISFFLGVLAFQTDQPFLGWFAVALLGASLGFFPYNFRRSGPATIFLGDTGSTFLGFTLACLAVLGEWAKNNPIVSISAPAIIFGVLIFDMVHTTVARFQSGKVHTLREWLEYTGKDHLHHRLAEVLSTPRQSVLFIFLLSSCLGLTSTVMRYARSVDAILLVLQAAVILLLVTILEQVGRWRKNSSEEMETGARAEDKPGGSPDRIEKETS